MNLMTNKEFMSLMLEECFQNCRKKTNTPVYLCGLEKNMKTKSASL